MFYYKHNLLSGKIPFFVISFVGNNELKRLRTRWVPVAQVTAAQNVESPAWTRWANFLHELISMSSSPALFYNSITTVCQATACWQPLNLMCTCLQSGLSCFLISRIREAGIVWTTVWRFLALSEHWSEIIAVAALNFLQDLLLILRGFCVGVSVGLST